MRLIDADALIETIGIRLYSGAVMEFVSVEDIAKQPTVDAVPVRHGKWGNDCVGVLRCSECNAQAPWKYDMDYIDYRWKANYCPNCGARMDGE